MKRFRPFEMIGRLGRATSNQTPHSTNPHQYNLTPKTPLVTREKVVVAIGDIHGRADLLDALFLKISDLKTHDPREMHLVFLGDYIDRGHESRKVIDTLCEIRDTHPHSYFLRGNHEATLLALFEDSALLNTWLNFGGRETLASYGLYPPLGTLRPEALDRLQDNIKNTLPSSHIDFVKATEISVEIDGCFFVHAGVNPNNPLDAQVPQDLMWIRDEFLRDTRPLPRVIVHGHTPEETPTWDGRRIGVDTGAYISGRLTAAIICADSVRFLYS